MTDPFLEDHGMTPPPQTEPVLSRTDLDSPTWRKIAAHLESQLQAMRALNDHAQPSAQTDMLRGRIVAIKDLLRLGSDPLGTSL